MTVCINLEIEEKKLEETLKEVRKQINELGNTVFKNKSDLLEYEKAMWKSKRELDKGEWLNFIKENDLKIASLDELSLRLSRLSRVVKQPYFGSFVFNKEKFYIGIMSIKKDLDYLVLDWRAPISSLFYDYTVGPCSYVSPEGVVKGNITDRRQYKIENGKLLHVFENNINIDDEALQEVLRQNSSEKMKDIVNTIQSEQNVIIRNTFYKTIIVQGIAGSGKTSVALHRIAFLLYRIEYLTSNNILIFSPNHVFSDYISDVLPALGEENTKETLYNEFLSPFLREFEKVESYSSFVGRFYKNKVKDNELITYKMSDEFVKDLEDYVEQIVKKAMFIKPIKYKDKEITVDELNILLRIRYRDKPLFERMNLIAEKLNNTYYKGKNRELSVLKRRVFKSVNFKGDFLNLYNDFFKSALFNRKYKMDSTEISYNKINYEDATPLVYLKCLLEEFPYQVAIRHVIIDEAQDYTYLQYKLIAKIFKNAEFTILGDVNQSVNPYYKYDTLDKLLPLFKDSKYMELKKSYRSSPEIINYANEVLNLNYVSAIRNSMEVPVLKRSLKDIQHIGKDIKYLKSKYKSVAVITKTNKEAELLAKSLQEKYSNVSLIGDLTKTFNKELIVAPAYGVKGLEFDSVIIVNNFSNDKNLLYVAITRAQHELIVYG